MSHQRTRRKPEPPVEVDRLRWIGEQLARVTLLAEETGTRDVQGLGRLMGEMRQLRDMYDAEVASRQQADASGDASVLEGRLVEALVAMDAARLARVLRETAKRLGVDLTAWTAAT